MAQWLAGQRLTASKLSTTRLDVTASSTMSTSGTATDVPGVAHTFTTTRDNVDVTVTGVFNIVVVATTGTFHGIIDVDGTSTAANFFDSATGVRATMVVQDVVTLATAGSHTIKLQARQTSGTDSFELRTSTGLMCVVEDNV